MGRYAQSRHRGRGIATSTVLPVPVLVVDEHQELSWTVAGDEPVKVQIWFDDGSGYVLAATQDWESVYDAPPVAGAYKVRGTTAGAVPTTQFSNIITIA